MAPLRMIAALASFVAAGAGLSATAEAAAGQAVPWQLGFQDAVTPVMRDIVSIHNLLLVISVLIVLFVTALMIHCMLRFNAKANPVPSKTTHNTLIEVVWTVVPVLLLVVIAIPSFKLIYFADRAVDAEMTLKAIGHQWYWSYEYPDNGAFEFDAVMLEDDERKAGQPRLLATDNAIVVPIDTTIRLLVTADDVLHAWAMPSFGVKIDAVPGKLNEAWFKIEKAGTYYGQCSELCGVRHGFMPIMVKAVAKKEFKLWAEKAAQEFAKLRQGAPVRLAGAEAAAGR